MTDPEPRKPYFQGNDKLMRFIYGQKIKKMKQKVTIVDKVNGKVNNMSVVDQNASRSKSRNRNAKVEKDYIKEVSDMLIG